MQTVLNISLAEDRKSGTEKASIQVLSITRWNNNDNIPESAFMTRIATVLIQIYCGDLNAEPHEDAIEFLTNRNNFQACEQNSVTGKICYADSYKDSWLHANNNVESEDGYTFPACNPVKRIDFIFVRNVSNGEYYGVVKGARIIGRRPTPETGSSSFISSQLSFFQLISCTKNY